MPAGIHELADDIALTRLPRAGVHRTIRNVHAAITGFKSTELGEMINKLWRNSHRHLNSVSIERRI
jgi:hypothetical protein